MQNQQQSIDSDDDIPSRRSYITPTKQLHPSRKLEILSP